MYIYAKVEDIEVLKEIFENTEIENMDINFQKIIYY